MSKEHQAYVITGAGSYLGKAFAEYLSANKNNKIFLTSRRKEDDFLERLRNNNIMYLPDIDLTKKEKLDELHEQITNFIPKKFHVINCVGCFPGYKIIGDMDYAEIAQVYNSNLLSLTYVAHRLVPLMCKRGGGHFIGFSMHTAYQHYPKMVAFTAAKIAVER